MDVTVEFKPASRFKLTITVNDEVRIKTQKDSDYYVCDDFVNRFTEIAQEVIREGLNTTTIRGRCRATDEQISLYDDHKRLVKTFKF